MIGLLFAASVFAYTEQELDHGRACTKIMIDLFKNNFHVIEEMVEKKPELSRKKLEDKIFADMLEYCIHHAPFEIVEPVMYFMGNRTWEEFKEYLKVDLDSYKTDEDLTVSQEHLSFRKEIVRTEGGMKYIGDPKDKEEATRRLKEKWRKEGKDPEKMFANRGRGREPVQDDSAGDGKNSENTKRPKSSKEFPRGKQKAPSTQHSNDL